MPYNNLISRADAAALVPEQVSQAMLTGLQNESAVLNLFTRIPVAASQVRFPVLSALPTAYFVSGDTGLKQTTEVNWANKYLNVEEIAAIVPIPEAVLDDQTYDIWGQVQPLVSNAIARTLDAAVFFGTNAPGTWPTAVVTNAVSAGNVVARGTNAAAAGGIHGDVSDLMATLEADGFDANAAVGNTTLKGRFRQARSTTGEALDDPFVNQFLGDVRYPMRGLWPTGASAAELVGLDRTQFVLGVRQDVTMRIIDQGVITDGDGNIIYNLPQQDMIAARFVFRAGWQVSNPITYEQGTESARYPAAVLRSPA